jgi:hypothetical protein
MGAFVVVTPTRAGKAAVASRCATTHAGNASNVARGVQEGLAEGRLRAIIPRR